MPTWAVILLIVCIMVPVDLAVVYALLRGPADEVFNALHKRYPPQDVSAGAVRRSFQSVKKDIVNMGWSVHFAVDDAFVHVMPAAVLRWCGAKASSVPVQLVREKRASARFPEIAFGEFTLRAPAWVLREAIARANLLNGSGA